MGDIVDSGIVPAVETVIDYTAQLDCIINRLDLIYSAICVGFAVICVVGVLLLLYNCIRSFITY